VSAYPRPDSAFDFNPAPSKPLAVFSSVPPPAWLSLLLIAAYAIGGISPGWLIVKLAGGGDIRQQGSGATGATNVGRVLGAKGFLYVLFLDACKGALAVAAVRLLLPGNPWDSLALPAVIAGHIWPVWLGFRGGKGGGPLLGGTLALRWELALFPALLGIAIGLLGRNKFLAGASAFFISLIAMWWLLPLFPDRIAYLSAAVLVLLAHRSYLTKYFKS
jgi:acyl phosphate:glycerol-3-phosphate acyltransferase